MKSVRVYIILSIVVLCVALAFFLPRWRKRDNSFAEAFASGYASDTNWVKQSSVELEESVSPKHVIRSIYDVSDFISDSEDISEDTQFFVSFKDLPAGLLLKFICKIKKIGIEGDIALLDQLPISIHSESSIDLKSIEEALINVIHRYGFQIRNIGENLITIVNDKDPSFASNLSFDNNFVVTKVIRFTTSLSKMTAILTPPIVSENSTIRYIENESENSVGGGSESSGGDGSSISSSASVSRISGMNIVIITDTIENIEKIEKLIFLIESEASPLSIVEYKPKNIALEKLFEFSESVMASIHNTKACLFTIDEANEQILLLGKEEDVMFVRNLLEKFDSEKFQNFLSVSKPSFRVRKIVNGKAENIVDMLIKRASSVDSSNPTLAKSLRTSTHLGQENLVMFSASSKEHDAYISSIIDSIENKAQIYIDMLIVAVDEAKFSSLGIDWSISDAKTGEIPDNKETFAQMLQDSSSIVGQKTTPLGFGVGMIGKLLSIKGSPVALMSAVANVIAKDTTSKVLSQPYIGGVEGEKAEIFVGKTVPVTIGRKSVNNSTATASSSISEETTTIDIGTRISFIGHVNENDMVRIQLNQEISREETSSVSGVSGANSYKYPSLLKVKYDTILLIPNKTIVVVGGLTLEGHDVESNGIPCGSKLCGVLRSIVNLMGGYKKETTYRQNLLIFIKPTIVRTEEELRRLNGEKLDRLQEKGADYGKIDNFMFWNYVDELQ
ncbi:MAG: hypothetical protein KAH32_01495 [Chlamydiia bacterium]|nr:hypothetical protein [Chlamydiia bacterium]